MDSPSPPSFEFLPPRLIISHILVHLPIFVRPDTPIRPYCPHYDPHASRPFVPIPIFQDREEQVKYDAKFKICESCLSSGVCDEAMRTYCQWTLQHYLFGIGAGAGADFIWQGATPTFVLSPMSFFGRFKNDRFRYPWFLFRTLRFGNWMLGGSRSDPVEAARLLREQMVFSARYVEDLKVSDSFLMHFRLVCEMPNLRVVQLTRCWNGLNWRPQSSKLEKVVFDVGRSTGLDPELVDSLVGVRACEFWVGVHTTPLAAFLTHERFCAELKSLMIYAAEALILEGIPDSLSHLVHFDFSHDEGILNRGTIRHILVRNSPTLESLHLDIFSEIGQISFGDTLSFPRLKSLSVCSVDYSGMTLPSLVKFSAHSCSLSSLKCGEFLRSVYLLSCPIPNQFFDVIAGSLEELSLRDSRFDGSPPPAFPKVRTLFDPNLLDFEETRFPALKTLHLFEAIEAVEFHEVEELHLKYSSFSMIEPILFEECTLFPSLKILFILTDQVFDVPSSILRFFLRELRQETRNIPETLQKIVVEFVGVERLVWEKALGVHAAYGLDQAILKNPLEASALFKELVVELEIE